MRNSNWWLVLGAATGLIFVALFVLALLPGEPGVTRANHGRLKASMARADAETILGPANETAPNGRVWPTLVFT